MGVVEGNISASGNDWEQVTRGGPVGIQRWIDRQLFGKSCTVVLIGAQTSRRKWIDYEIKKTWNEGKALLGIHIHGLSDLHGNRTSKGENPFQKFSVGNVQLSDIVETYEPPFWFSSRDTYNYIRSNFEGWIERAIMIRASHSDY